MAIVRIIQGYVHKKPMQYDWLNSKNYIYFLGLIGGYFAPQTFVILEKPGCAICEYVINDLQTIIGSNRSEAQIEAGLEKVCTLMVVKKCNL